jgi:SNF2 family DNA or RNA helicase
MLVSKKHRKLMLNLRDPQRVMTLIPTATTMSIRGKDVVIVPHREDEVRVLRNLGFDAPAPMGYYYDWPGMYKPFAHQKTTAEFLTTNPRSFCLNGMGSGKTLSVLWAFHYLKSMGLVKRMLVISPLSTLERTWGDEIFKHFTELQFTVLHGSREKRHLLIDNDFDIYIINHDGIKSDETVKKLVGREGLDLIVIDEIASFRNASTDRWKYLNKIIKDKVWVWGLTGTPTPQEPTDAWAQIRLINPGGVPKYFSHFREQVMQPLTQFKWSARKGATDIVSRVMQPSIRFSREECIDLPPTTMITRQTALSPEQVKMYKEMLTQLNTEHDGGKISAVNEATKLGKLLQILCGAAYSYNEDGQREVIDIPSKPRIELVKEIIEEAGAKVIVFVPLTGALEALATELRKDYSVEVVHGGVSRLERDRIFAAFQKAKDPRVLVANAAAMSHGLTLTAANTIVWFAPPTSNEVYEQANARIVRPGQKLNTLIVNIEGSDIERRMYSRLQHRGKMQGLLLDLLKGPTP